MLEELGYKLQDLTSEIFMDEAGLVKGIYCICFKAVASCSSSYSEEDF